MLRYYSKVPSLNEKNSFQEWQMIYSSMQLKLCQSSKIFCWNEIDTKCTNLRKPCSSHFEFCFKSAIDFTNTIILRIIELYMNSAQQKLRSRQRRMDMETSFHVRNYFRGLPCDILYLYLIQLPAVPMCEPTLALQRFQHSLRPPQTQHRRDEVPTKHTRLRKGQTFSHMLLHVEIYPCTIWPRSQHEHVT